MPGELFLREPSGVCRFDSAEALLGEESSRWEYRATTPGNASRIVVVLCLDCFLGAGGVGGGVGGGGPPVLLPDPEMLIVRLL